MKTLQLQAPSVSGDLPNFESISAEELGPNHYQLLSSPASIPGLAEGDEFALDRHSAAGFKVLKREGNVVVWFFLPGEEFHADAAVAELEADLEDLGGRLDEAADSSLELVATIPLSAGFPAIEAAFDRALEMIPDSAAQYGCVSEATGFRAEWLDRG